MLTMDEVELALRKYEEDRNFLEALGARLSHRVLSSFLLVLEGDFGSHLFQEDPIWKREVRRRLARWAEYNSVQAFLSPQGTLRVRFTQVLPQDGPARQFVAEQAVGIFLEAALRLGAYIMGMGEEKLCLPPKHLSLDTPDTPGLRGAPQA